MEFLPYFLAAIFVLLTGMQFRVLLKARRQKGRAAPDYQRVLRDDLKDASRLLFFFHSEQCPPCRTMVPAIERLAARSPNVVWVDVGHHRELAREFGVAATPSCALVERGTIVKMLVGAVSYKRLEKLLDEAG